MPDRSEHVPVIAVASGKGGVGKTTRTFSGCSSAAAAAARRPPASSG
jgi:MinD-like ATPase involved in chromosome partitioning or flagellar assembly